MSHGKIMVELLRLQRDLSTIISQAIDTKTKKSEETKSATVKEAKKDGTALSRLLVSALLESGNYSTTQPKKSINKKVAHKKPSRKEKAEQKQVTQDMPDLGTVLSGLYPKYTTHFVLLSFLYQKITSVQELKDYCAQFKPSILKENAEEILENAELDKSITIEFLEKEFSAVGNKQAFIDNNFERITLATVFKALQERTLPKLSDYVRCSIGEDSFNPCAENTVLNFVRILMAKIGIYDRDAQCYRAEKIAGAVEALLKDNKIPYAKEELAKKLENITSFFTKFPDARLASAGDLHQAWVNLISNLPDVKYLRAVRKDNGEYFAHKTLHAPFVHPVTGKKYDLFRVCGDDVTTYELSGSPDNVLNIANYLFGLSCTTLAGLCNLFGFRGEGVERLSDDVLYKMTHDLVAKVTAEAPSEITADVDKLEEYLFKKVADAPELRGKATLVTEILGKSVQLKLSTTLGHSEVTDETVAKVEFSLSTKGLFWFAINQLGFSVLNQQIYALKYSLDARRTPLRNQYARALDDTADPDFFYWRYEPPFVRYFYLAQPLSHLSVIKVIIKEILEQEPLLSMEDIKELVYHFLRSPMMQNNPDTLLSIFANIDIGIMRDFKPYIELGEIFNHALQKILSTNTIVAYVASKFDLQYGYLTRALLRFGFLVKPVLDDLDDKAADDQSLMLKQNIMALFDLIRPTTEKQTNLCTNIDLLILIERLLVERNDLSILAAAVAVLKNEIRRQLSFDWEIKSIFKVVKPNDFNVEFSTALLRAMTAVRLMPDKNLLEYEKQIRDALSKIILLHDQSDTWPERRSYYHAHELPKEKYLELIGQYIKALEACIARIDALKKQAIEEPAAAPTEVKETITSS